MSAEFSHHSLIRDPHDGDNAVIAITLFPLEDLPELVKPEITTESGAGNNSTMNARRRIQRSAFPSWRRR